MYRYLPTDINAQKKIVQFRGGILLIYRTEKVFRDILWWFVMCAQEARCFVPNFNIYCNFAPHDRYTKFAKCHRFDQASINIIMSNIWMRDNSMLYTADDAFFNIVREFEAAIAEKVEQLGLDFRKMHDHAYNVLNVCIVK
ncbi:hypothetical protein LSAT2_009998 [Lamellibrachia satsuma]|nr:hypothetical protein LSAT2_009998 [Lamellibrachia satsuma]